MAKIISILNLKGGVGKSTSAVNIAAAMNEQGSRVLVIDTDPQANAGKLLGLLGEEEYRSIEDAYKSSLKGEQVTLPIIRRPGGMDVIPSSLGLASLEMALNNAIKKDERLERMLRPVQSDYDYILIDCPPSLNIFVINALMASDCVMVPVESQALALQGMEDVIGLIEQIRAFKPELYILGMFLTKFDSRTTLSKKVDENVRERYGEYVFRTNIRWNITAAETPLFGQHLFEYDPRCNSARDYWQLTAEIIERLK